VSDCARYESLIERYLASDLDPKGMSDLLAHAAGCEGCRRLLALHGELERAGSAVPEPNEADLERRQVRVLAGIQRRRALLGLAGVVLLLTGYGIGRWQDTPAPVVLPRPASTRQTSLSASRSRASLRSHQAPVLTQCAMISRTTHSRPCQTNCSGASCPATIPRRTSIRSPYWRITPTSPP